MDNFAEHMFTEAVREEQRALGMEERFQKVYRNRFTDGLNEDARAFIESRTSFYIATVGETGWPYVQHRGGPAGFLKVLDDETLGFADYTGNKQLISKGNLRGNDRVSLFLMDYPRRARMKLIGHATMIEAEKDPELAERLRSGPEDPVERLTTIRVVAYDWNCPKYILPRFTEDEVRALIAPHLAKCDATIQSLADRLAALGEDLNKLPSETPDD